MDFYYYRFELKLFLKFLKKTLDFLIFLKRISLYHNINFQENKYMFTISNF